MFLRSCFRKSGTDGLVSIFKIAVADSCGVRYNPYSTSPSSGMLTNSTNSVTVKKRFEDKVVIITGGASGIGEATTRLFVANGAHVYIADIDSDRGSRLSEELGEHVQYLYCDVRKEEDVAATVDKTIQEKGKLDIYFSNAGFVGALGSIDKLSLADFDETLAVNLRGAVVSIKHAARVMKPVRRGSIICTGSVASELGGLGPHTYCISKTALKGLVRSTALELRSYGIRVNMVSPDATPTPMFMKVIKDGTGIPMTFEQAKSRMAKKSLILDRPLADLDVANAVLFLASEEAGYISGHNLLLDAAKTVTVPFPAGYDHWFAGWLWGYGECKSLRLPQGYGPDVAWEERSWRSGHGGGLFVDMVIDSMKETMTSVKGGQQQGGVEKSGEDGDENSPLAIAVRNGEDLGSFIRHAFEKGKPEALIQQLKHFVRRREVEIEELCKVHFAEFIRAVDELRHVLVDAQELKSGLSAENVQLQMVADSLLARLDVLIQYQGTKLNLMQAVQAMKTCVTVLGLCMKVNSYMASDSFYPVLKLLDIMERDFMPHVPARVLRELLEGQIPACRAYIEKRVTDGFNEWLVQIRTIARDIGQLSIGQASAARQREEELRGQQRQSEEQSRSGAQIVYILETEEDVDEEDVKLKFDLTPVYRAYHINTCLGLQDRFRDYYFKNRQLQLKQDLEIYAAQSFLEIHQVYFAQLAGFFIVEDRVFRSAGGLVTSAQAELLWESAVTTMTAVLEDQFTRMEDANHLLLVKDYVSLLGVTLRRHGYQVGPLLDVLDTMSDKYHELLLQDCHRRFQEVLLTDKYELMVMNREYEYKMHVLAFQLQNGDVTPAMPYVAPFSATVPECCRIVRSFILDSVSFLSYGGHMDYYELVRRYLDKLLISELNEALLCLVRTPSLGVSDAMQIAANMSVLERACDYFSQHAAKLCGIPMRLLESYGELSARSKLRESQSVAHNTVLELVRTKVDEYMVGIRQVNWNADEVPQGRNEYLQDVLTYLDTIAQSSQAISWPETFNELLSGVLSHISDCIVGALVGDDLKRFNIHGIMGIDMDLQALESAADDWDRRRSAADKLAGLSFKDCLAEARQFINLLSGNQPELYLNPVIRQRNYNALDVDRVIIVCEKFKDLPEKMFAGRNTRQAQKRKSLDTLLKQLKLQ